MAITYKDVEFNEELFRKLDQTFDGVPEFHIIIAFSRVMAKICRNNETKPHELIEHVRKLIMMEMLTEEE